MKVDYASDLHFNHWMTWTENQLKWEKRTKELTQRLSKNGNSEVLVLAGDFSEWNNQTIWILEEAARNYEKVFYTFGNHDLYLISKSQKKKYIDSLGRLEELINEASKIPNVVPLIKNTHEYKGKLFAGDAMWYLPKSQEDWAFFNNVSNDSSCIRINGYWREDIPRKLYKDSMDWYDTIENLEVDVFVSHVPPIHPTISQYEPNGCYMTTVPFINAEHWICGHTHDQGEFEKVGVKFHMNAIGYGSEYTGYKRNTIPESKDYNGKVFGLKTFEI